MNNFLVHETTQLQIDSIISSKNLNAVGLEGDSGSGKSILALEIAGKVLDVPNALEYPYLIQVDCKDNSGIETSRNIKKFLNLKVPSEKEFNRCLILHNIENLTDEAQNALLKTLEEPPAKTFIIVTTNSKNLCKPTITSRIQWVSVLPIQRKKLEEVFANKYSTDEFNFALAVSKGNFAAFRDTLDGPQDNSKKDYIALAKKILSSTRFEKMCEVDKLVKDKDLSVNEVLSALNQILRAVLLKSVKQDKNNSPQILRKIELVNEAQNDLAKNVNEKLVVSKLFYHL